MDKIQPADINSIAKKADTPSRKKKNTNRQFKQSNQMKNEEKVTKVVDMTPETTTSPDYLNEGPQSMPEQDSNIVQLTEEDLKDLIMVHESVVTDGQERSVKLGVMSKPIADKVSSVFAENAELKTFKEETLRKKIDEILETINNIKLYYLDNDIENVKFWNLSKLVKFAKYVISELEQLKKDLRALKNGK
jgi:hypothetical protein